MSQGGREGGVPSVTPNDSFTRFVAPVCVRLERRNAEVARERAENKRLKEQHEETLKEIEKEKGT